MATDEAPAAIAILVAEHDVCRRHLQASVAALSEGASGRAAQAALDQAWLLLDFLETGLETHIAREEGPLFPRLKAALPVDDRLIDEMVAEHDLIRIKRADIRSTLMGVLDDHEQLRHERDRLLTALAHAGQPIPALPHIRQAVDVIATKLRVHFENEEDLVFPLAPEILGEDELRQVLAEMEALAPVIAAP
jgi:hemerythrin-like domain-containing protein